MVTSVPKKKRHQVCLMAIITTRTAQWCILSRRATKFCRWMKIGIRAQLKVNLRRVKRSQGRKTLPHQLLKLFLVEKLYIVALRGTCNVKVAIASLVHEICLNKRFLILYSETEFLLEKHNHCDGAMCQGQLRAP